jgi:ABC-type transporter Mla MlaB component
MLRITSIPWANGRQRIKVEGRLAGEFVAELSRVTATALEESGMVMVDLADVTFVDHSGALLLRSLRAAGVELVDCSQFVQTMMLD